MWKVGLIGTGYWSDKHLKAWSRIPNVEIAALCNRSRDKMLKKSKEFKVPEDRLYSSLEEMLEQSDIDIVDIVTGPETHLPFVKQIAAAGKHIMCQKPFAPSYHEAEEMVRIAKRANVRLMVTENWRWLQPFQMIKRILEEGTLGKLHVARYIHTDYYTPRMAPDKELPQPFFRTMPKLLFYEMGVHWYDTWRYLFGEPKRLYAETNRVSPYIVGEDTGIITLGYDDFYGVLDMSWATRRELTRPFDSKVLPDHLEQLTIEGEKATLKQSFHGVISIVDLTGNETVLEQKTELDHEESHFRLQSHFIDCLDSGKEFQTSGEDNLKTLKLTFGTYESAAEHKVIRI